MFKSKRHSKHMAANIDIYEYLSLTFCLENILIHWSLPIDIWSHYTYMPIHSCVCWKELGLMFLYVVQSANVCE